MKEIVGDIEHFPEVETQLRAAMDSGDIDQVLKIAHIEEEYATGDEEKLLEQERRIQAIELSLGKITQEVVHDVLKELHELEQKYKSNKTVMMYKDHITKKFDEMFKQEREELVKEHQAALDQLRAEKGDRSEEEHSWAIRTRGVAVLARAMNNVYQLRKKKREVQREFQDIVDQLKLIESGKGSKDKLDKEIDEATTKVVELFRDITHIDQVFVAYFFVLQHQDETYQQNLGQLKEDGFPDDNLQALLEEHDKDEQHVLKIADEINDTSVRMRQLADA